MSGHAAADRELFDALKAHVDKFGYPASASDVAQQLGLSEKVVSKRLRALAADPDAPFMIRSPESADRFEAIETSTHIEEELQ